MKTSILINNYNNGPWLRECVNSALNQTRPADEIIVYDDGSTDDSISILRSYGNRITLIEGVHDSSQFGMINQSAAIHAALLASTGNHIHLLDGDDAYCPERIESYERLWLSQPDAVMVHGPLEIIDSNGANLESAGHILIPPERHLAWIYQHNRPDGLFPTSALAFRRDFLHRHLPLDLTDQLHYAVDARLSILALCTGSILLLTDPQTRYRKRAASMSSAILCLTQAANTRIQCEGFNLTAAIAGKPPINYWFNHRYYRQLLRELLPKRLGDFLAQFRKQ